MNLLAQAMEWYFANKAKRREARTNKDTIGPVPCRHCQHFLNRQAGTDWAKEWWAHVCKAHQFDNCREYIRDGECSKFKARGKLFT